MPRSRVLLLSAVVIASTVSGLSAAETPKSPVPKAAPAKAPAPKSAPAAPKQIDPLASIPADARPADLEVPPAAGGAELTVYPNDLAMVREHRSFRLATPFTRITLPGLAASLQPESALFQVIKGPPLRFVEQSFDFNLLTPARLLEKAVGREVTIITTNASGTETTNRALVLSAADGLVVQMNGRIHTNPPGRVVYDSLPPGMHATPSLTMTVAGTPGQDMDGELSYLTSGLSWRTDYVMEYDPEGNRMDFNAWANITNTTNVDFRDARLKLVTGQVSRETARPLPMPMKAMAMAARAPAAAPAPPEAPTEESLVGNHIYTMPRPTTLVANETKQLALLSVQNVAVKRENVLRGQPAVFQQNFRDRPQTSAVGIELSFKNDATAKLGGPLPAGTLRVYSVDQQGSPQFIGENRVEYTAEDADVTLQAGRDYDLPVLREQLNFVRASDNITLTMWRITIKNTGAKPQTVRVVEPLPGAWEITKESQPHTKSDAGSAEWALQIPAKGQVALEYNVKSTL